VDVVILCGGRGTRLQERTQEIPKPLVEIGGRPILWHIIRLYAEQGLRRFVLCTGYKGEAIEAFVAGEPWPDGVEVACVDTGPDTPTGGRILRVADRVGERFCATYGDGLADIDLAALRRFHESSGRSATVTAVRPAGRFGALDLDGDRVSSFVEKPDGDGSWVNGGFFVLSPGCLDLIGDDATIWEQGPLSSLADDADLAAYRHDGFWQCMDTLRDRHLLEQLWSSGRAPWRIW
jgi:glucose-1-phosphate cytidylyltransferase